MRPISHCAVLRFLTLCFNDISLEDDRSDSLVFKESDSGILQPVVPERRKY